MRIKELDYSYPEELVAHTPASPRDSARLLVFNKKDKNLSHSCFCDIGNFLKPGDVLVLNKTKVFPARIFTHNSRGKQIEIVFLSEVQAGRWEIIVGGRLQDGEEIMISPRLKGRVLKTESGNFLEIKSSRLEVLALLEKFGHVPLPPYIKREDNAEDKSEYQTVFAETVGSAAAPTAGLHFTKKLLSSLRRQGIQIEYVTLHVGLGTFAPVKSERVENHPIHSEYYEINAKTAQRLNLAKNEERRIIACGTTVVRALESSVKQGLIQAEKGETSLFIYPGYKFKVVDGLITNFHTPRSSLLALVYAFSGATNIKKIYRLGIKEKYRLFSYGDAMLLL